MHVYVLYRRGKKKKILKWFEEVFTQVSGDDHLLQMDEFKRALLINGVRYCCCVLCIYGCQAYVTTDITAVFVVSVY